MIHERIARVFVCAVHRGGVALGVCWVELVVAQGSFSYQQKDQMRLMFVNAKVNSLRRIEQKDVL